MLPKDLDGLLPAEIRQDPRRLRQGRLILGVCFVLLGILGVGVVVRWMIRPFAYDALALILVAFVGWICVPLVLRYTRSLRLAGGLTAGILLALLAVQLHWSGGPGAPVGALLALVPLVAVHLMGSRFGPAATALTVGVILAVGAFGLWNPAAVRRPPLAPREAILAHVLLLTLTVLLVGLLTMYFERQRRSLEVRLRQTDQLYQRLFDQSKDMVALSRPSGEILDVNQAGVDLYGFPSREAFLSRSSQDLWVYPEKRREMLEKLERDGFVRNYESLHRRSDGELRTVQGTTTVVRDRRGEITHILSILRDVTRERQAAAELERKNEDLESFTYAVSHDLKSPLLTVRGCLEMIGEDLDLGDLDRAREDQGHALRTVVRMQAMVDDLLTLATVGAAEQPSTSVDLGEMAEELSELLAGRFDGAGVELEILDLPTVHGDRALLRLALQNLMDNAAKFSASVDSPRVRVGCRREEERVVVFVQDNGPGVEAEDRRRIFRLFSRIDRKGEGSGIGLAMVKKVVALHGGEVWVESEGAGAGSTFCFSLPEVRDGEREKAP